MFYTNFDFIALFVDFACAVILGHVVQLKEMCSPIEGAGFTVAPLWQPKNNCPSLLCLLLYSKKCRSYKPKEYPHAPLYASRLNASSFIVA